MARWTWVEIYPPWGRLDASVFTQRHPRHFNPYGRSFTTFETASEAIIDLRDWLLDVGGRVHYQTDSLPQVPLGEFVIWFDDHRAWMVFTVPEGASPVQSAALATWQLWQHRAREVWMKDSVSRKKRHNGRMGLWQPK
ncbi:hypothetical protein P3T27_007572 [Kitasatospora sp. MAA19]|nr:hypothetical protein [Kitasatospora sp. MAA19]